jgi:hypothetical protein
VRAALALFAAVLAWTTLAPPPALAECKPVVIEYYYMKNCRIKKTKRWDEKRQHWDVKSERNCK